MSKNDEIRKKKERAVKEAIDYLKASPIPLKKITNVMIVETVKELYPTEADKHINVNTLSKQQYYRDNIPKWLDGHNGRKKSSEAAIKAKKIQKAKKLKRLNKYGHELLNKIKKGQVDCHSFTREFVRNWIEENKGEKLSQSIFSSSPDYKELFERLTNEYYKQEVETASGKGNISEIGKLKRELKEKDKKLNDLITNTFISINQQDNPMSEGDSSEFKGVNIDVKSLYKYLNFIEDKMGNQVDAYQFIKSIIENCKIIK